MPSQFFAQCYTSAEWHSGSIDSIVQNVIEWLHWNQELRMFYVETSLRHMDESPAYFSLASSHNEKKITIVQKQ